MGLQGVSQTPSLLWQMFNFVVQTTPLSGCFGLGLVTRKWMTDKSDHRNFLSMQFQIWHLPKSKWGLRNCAFESTAASARSRTTRARLPVQQPRRQTSHQCGAYVAAHRHIVDDADDSPNDISRIDEVLSVHTSQPFPRGRRNSPIWPRSDNRWPL